MMKLAKLLKVFAVIALLLTIFPNSKVSAEGGTFFSESIPVDKDNTVHIDLSTGTTYVDTDIPRGRDNAIEMVKGTTYVATYSEALHYFGNDLTVVVTAKLSDTGNMDPTDAEHTGHTKIYIDADGLVRIRWDYAYNVKVDYTVSILDKDGNPFEKGEFLFGFNDPDESNYLFTTSGKDFYRIDKGWEDGVDESLKEIYPETAAKSYKVKSDGLYLIDKNGNECNPSTWTLPQNTPDYDDATFLVALDDSNSFSFSTNTFKNGQFALPSFYSLKGNWNVTYILNDSDEVPADNSGNEEFTKYESGVGFEREIVEPTREGYDFKGWKRHDVSDPESEDNYWVQKYDFGDKVFEAKWEAKPRTYKVEYYYMNDNGQYPDDPDSLVTRDSKNYETVSVTEDDKKPTKKDYVLDDAAEHIYEEVITPDGDTVLKVYFKKSYTVTYKPGTQGTFVEQVNPELDYGVDTPEFKGTPEGNEGYDFVGWDKEIADTVTENAVYVAQWEPWKYFIKYDPNGGVGDMPKQTFVYTDDVMKSKKNEFTRDGYDFIGFEFENDGTKYIITNTKDFNDMLKELGPNSTITLVAQWKKLPDPVVKYYALPVTGVEDRR